MKTLLAIIGILVILLCAGAVLVLVLGVALTGGDEARKVGQVDAPAPEQPPAGPVGTFAVGDVIQTSEWGEDWTITVRSVEYPTGDPWRPKEGHKFVLLTLEVVNASDEAQVLSSISAYRLKDSQNREYSSWTTSAAPGNTPSGDFAALEPKSGPVVFQVPVDAAGFVFVFAPTSLGTQRVFVRLE